MVTNSPVDTSETLKFMFPFAIEMTGRKRTITEIDRPAFSYRSPGNEWPADEVKEDVIKLDAKDAPNGEEEMKEEGMLIFSDWSQVNLPTLDREAYGQGVLHTLKDVLPQGQVVRTLTGVLSS